MKCEHISPSRATLYEQCALRYEAHYEFNMPEQTNQRQDTGLLVHKALELYYSPRFSYTPEDAWTLALKGHECSPFEEYKAAKTMYLETISKFPRQNGRTIDTECSFDYTFDSGLNIKGIVDRIDIANDDTLRIIDFKTGMRVMSMQEMRDSHQANLYALWAFSNPAFASFKHIIFSLFYIREGVFRDIHMIKDQVMIYKEYLEFLAEQILNNTDPQPSLNSYCWNCPCSSTCPAYKKFIQDTVAGVGPFSDTTDILDIDIAYDTLSKIKSIMSMLERNKKMLESWLVCMIEECPERQHITKDKQKLGLTSKRSIKPDIGVVIQLAKDRNVEGEVIDIKGNVIETVFAGDSEALDLIRASSTIEYGQPYLTVSKASKGKGDIA